MEQPLGGKVSTSHLFAKYEDGSLSKGRGQVRVIVRVYGASLHVDALKDVRDVSFWHLSTVTEGVLGTVQRYQLVVMGDVFRSTGVLNVISHTITRDRTKRQKWVDHCNKR